MEDDTADQQATDEVMRPCDYCGHPVAKDSLDERDCPACGDPEWAADSASA
ncbi:hypothetical protein [Streptomyces sp. NPDC004135]